ncbi:hypothetical protein [Halalkalibacter urbisdiaboli]|uniref:hypothetical protein n=1 Tax=Halalkalibacter urbisdiaboli TaxID=1960589 RepID=UPI000B436EF5|nr:hypothetical protein [Halalkalibacter urbisdiaboli]
MNYVLTFIVSTFEWIALLSFPVILLGYYYRHYVKPILILAMTMSILSMILRLFPIDVFIVLAIQIIIFVFFVKRLFSFQLIESLVVVTIGYGFYILIQLLFIELIISTSTINYIDILFSLSFTPQMLTIIFMTMTCLVIHYFKYNLVELRRHVQSKTMTTKTKNIIYTSAVLTLIFICLAVFAMLESDFSHKHVLVLLCIIVLFSILSVYYILHTQFQMKSLIEAKQFYLDQEQQTTMILEHVKKNYARHFHAIMKLSERQSLPLITDYIDFHKLNANPNTFSSPMPIPSTIKENDELLYAFLINKRKVAGLVGVTIHVSATFDFSVPTSLQQIRLLSMIFDDIFLLLYQAPLTERKELFFEVYKSDSEIRFDISSNFTISGEQTSLKLFDALLKFKQQDALVYSELNPLKLTITCPMQ